MKIILTTASPSIDSDLEARFGRGAYLLVVNTESLQWEAHANPGASASGGAGIQAARFIAGQNAEAVISGDFGPHACEALQAAGIAMLLFGNCRTARQAIESFKAGQLQEVGAPTRGDCDSGHHGMSA